MLNVHFLHGAAVNRVVDGLRKRRPQGAILSTVWAAQRVVVAQEPRLTGRLYGDAVGRLQGTMESEAAVLKAQGRAGCWGGA